MCKGSSRKLFTKYVIDRYIDCFIKDLIKKIDNTYFFLGKPILEYLPVTISKWGLFLYYLITKNLSLSYSY